MSDLYFIIDILDYIIFITDEDDYTGNYAWQCFLHYYNYGNYSSDFIGRMNIDMRFEKYFKLVGLNWRFIVWVDNIFDNKNVDYVYPKTGRADTSQNDGQRVTGGSDYDRNPYNWMYGRHIKVGLQVSI